MKALLYNRILLALGCAGLFVAGVLSIAKVLHKVPPCGGSASSCDKVTNGPWSMWFHIPVAYFGLGAYIFLTGVAVWRQMSPPETFKKLTLVGYLVSVVGALTSIGLQFYSIFHIQDICKWCMASAIIMTITLIVYALMYQELVDLKPENAGAALSRKNWDFLITSALGFILLFGLSAEGYAIFMSDKVPGMWVDLSNLDKQKLQLIPPNANIYGDANAPLKIIEFADLNCPSCQQNSPLVKEFVREHPGKVCVIFRHFPLPTHKTSDLAAAIDEYAAEKGLFWDYTMAVMATKKEVDDPNELFDIAAQIHLDPKDIKKRLSDTKDPIFTRLTTDKNVANALGVSQTPTFILIAEGVRAKAFTSSSIFDALKSPPYDKFTGGS